MITDALLFTLAAIYAGRVLYFAVGFNREKRRWVQPDEQAFVSVVVPARNEQDNLRYCVESLVNSAYPKDKFEIIIVNDRSIDDTQAIAHQLEEEFAMVHVVHRTEQDVEGSLQGKAGALQQGIEECRADIVLLTDADCTVSATWIAGMAAQFRNDRVGVVSGLTSVSGSGIFQRVQDVEWLYTQSMAAGGVGNGTRLGCFGNNMAIRRSMFMELGGYRRIPFSLTEDMALQLAAFDAGYTLRFAVNPSICVTTKPCSSLAEYVKQRHRWVRGGMGLGSRAVVFVATSMTLWFGLAISAYTSSWYIFWSFVMLRLFADSVLISLSAIAIARVRMIPMILPSMCLLVLTELFIPLLVLKKTVTWKGQVFR